MRIKSVHGWACAVVVLSLFASTAAHAAINYGNSPVIAPGVQFLGITESSGTDTVPLFGAPASYLAVGIDFNPTGFAASGAGGTGDVTDGQLNFSVAGTFTPTVKVAINEISLSESGDYTLVGAGTAATQAFAGASLHVTVTEIDGVALAIPLVLTTAVSSVSYNLIANPGFLQPWSINTSVDIAALLTAAEVDFDYGATKIDVVIDDQLIALSQASSSAFIAKKDFKVNLENNVVLVPEPVQMSALVLGAIGIMARRRRARA